MEIKESTIAYSKQKSKARNDRLKSLEKQLSLFLQVDNPSFIVKHKIKMLEYEIEQLYNFKVAGAQIRSRVNLLEQGEKSSKYFFGLEKSRQCRKVINSLKVNNQVITDKIEILKQEVIFYKRLYQSENANNDCDTYLNSIELENILTEEQAEKCEGLLTFEQCSKTIHNMKSNKSPGLDGLTVEFYVKFWDLIGHQVVNSLNYGYKNGEMSISQKQCVISLIFKKGDPENLDNWRPIALLNIDYKIGTGSLADRLQTVLPFIISLDQQGFIKNRYIGYNIRQIQDVIDYTDILNEDGIILFLDFKKAFDTIEWQFMLKTLKKFGFKDNFINWVKVLYNDISSCIINNGWKSDFFSLSRGIRQGCPLSALLFIIVVEIMAIKIRSCRNINGITIKYENNSSAKITQLADDTTLFLKNKNEISYALSIIDEFGNYSGLKLNKMKTEGLWIGKSKNNVRTEECDIVISNSPIKALGVYFGHSQNIENLNWENKLLQCETLLTNWGKRNLTFYGKILVLKTLALPKFTYLFQNTTVPKHILSKY